MLKTGLPSTNPTVCISRREFAGLSRAMKASSTPFFELASCSINSPCQDTAHEKGSIPQGNLPCIALEASQDREVSEGICRLPSCMMKGKCLDRNPGRKSRDYPMIMTRIESHCHNSPQRLLLVEATIRNDEHQLIQGRLSHASTPDSVLCLLQHLNQTRDQLYDWLVRYSVVLHARKETS